MDGRREDDGKRQQKWRTFKTKKEAEAYARELIKSGSPRPSDKRSFAAWAEEWGNTYLTGLRPESVKSYRSHIKRWLPSLGHIPLTTLGPVDVQRAIAKMSGVYKPATVATYRRALHLCLEQAVKVGLIASNPVRATRGPKQEAEPVRVLSPDEIQRMLESLAGTPYRLPALIAVATGMRRAEILNLTWADVDLEGAQISVGRSKTAAGRRMVWAPEFLVQALRAERKRQAEYKLMLGRRYEDNNLVCCHFDGRPIPPGVLSTMFHRHVQRAGLEIRFHDLRHTHASLLLKAGVNMKVIQERLGHSSVTITLNTYSHLYAGMQEQAAVAIDEMIADSVAGDCK